VLERIRTVQEENLERLDDDLDILKAFLKSQHAPKAVIEALEGLTVEQHVSGKKAVDRIKKLLEGMRFGRRRGRGRLTFRVMQFLSSKACRQYAQHQKIKCEFRTLEWKK
jgi:hypothetical protein